MKVEVKEISVCEREMTIIVDAEQANKDYYKILSQIKQKANIPGFRPGKAPMHYVEQIYAETAKEEFMNKMMDVYYNAGLDEIDQNPVAPGQIKDWKWDKGQECTAVYIFEIMPEIIVEKYQGLEIPFEPMPIPEQSIENTLKDMQKQIANTSVSDQPLALNNKAHLVFVYADEPGKDYPTELIINAENNLGEEFNNVLIGKNVGDVVETTIQIPTQTGVESAKVSVKIEMIETVDMPELDDEFAKDFDCETLAELREKIRTDLQKDNEKKDKDGLYRTIKAKLRADNPISIPKSIIRNYASELVKQYHQSQGDLEKVMPIYYQIAENDIKDYYINQQLISNLKIEATEEDKENKIIELAAEINMDVEKYKEILKQQNHLENFNQRIIEEKLMNLIIESAKIVPYPKTEPKTEVIEEAEVVPAETENKE